MNPFGPYGKDITDDKPSLHKHGGLYYLSWRGFYAVSENVYGPYEYRGTVLSPESVAPDGPVLGTLELEESTNAGQHRTHRVTLSNHPGTLNLWIVAKGNGDDPETCRIDSFHFES